MSSVSAVAFAFMTPEAIRVFLQIAGYHVSVFDGNPESLDLRPGKPSSNVVILPNFAKRDMLEQHADQIGSLVLLTNGRHEDIIDLDIPILDSEIDGDDIRQARDRTPRFYTKKIKEAGAPLSLKAAKKVKQPEPPRDPETLDQWFDAIDQVFPKEGSFDHDVEYPVCQFLMGQLSRKELQGAMKIVVRKGADKDTVRQFYQWLTQRSDKMSAAMKAYLMPRAESEALTVPATAKKFKVDPIDISLIESVYLEMQKPAEEEANHDDQF